MDTTYMLYVVRSGVLPRFTCAARTASHSTVRDQISKNSLKNTSTSFRPFIFSHSCKHSNMLKWFGMQHDACGFHGQPVFYCMQQLSTQFQRSVLALGAFESNSYFNLTFYLCMCTTSFCHPNYSIDSFRVPVQQTLCETTRARERKRLCTWSTLKVKDRTHDHLW